MTTDNGNATQRLRMTNSAPASVSVASAVIANTPAMHTRQKMENARVNAARSHNSPKS
jgi:hypothetical protein